MIRVVIDTNVLVAALKSRRGASASVILLLGSAAFVPLVSVPLCLEYEEVLNRPGLLPGYNSQDISDYLDYVVSVSLQCRIHYLWRPHVSDANDDHVLEVALAGSASHIVTHNVGDFRNVSSLGISVVTPGEFVAMLSGA